MVVLNRPRNDDLVTELREVGARVNLIPHGDTAPAIAAARRGSGVDLVMGIGGTTEGVIAAAALKALGAASRVASGRARQRTRRAVDAGYDVDRIFGTDDLVRGDDVFVAATGVTTGALLAGVAYDSDGGVRSPIAGDAFTLRYRPPRHRRHTFDKLERFTGREYR